MWDTNSDFTKKSHMYKKKVASLLVSYLESMFSYDAEDLQLPFKENPDYTKLWIISHY